MNREVALHFRDQLRDACAIALKDAEAFEHFVFVIERIAVYLTGRIEDLKGYADPVAEQARRSPLAEDIPNQLPAWHAPFVTLCDLVRTARNDALHEGAFARHLTRHAVELMIVFEDALMEEAFGARDFMVRDLVCAFPWQPISSVRRNMLENSFSFLPMAAEPTVAPRWKLVSDFSLASFLRKANSRAERNRRLACQLVSRLIDSPR